jgi:stress response protein SCP2
VAIIPTHLTSLRVGLGWDTNCDIDSSIVLMDANNKELEIIYFGNK